jgi:hypothetical protein
LWNNFGEHFQICNFAKQAKTYYKTFFLPFLKKTWFQNFWRFTEKFSDLRIVFDRIEPCMQGKYKEEKIFQFCVPIKPGSSRGAAKYGNHLLGLKSTCPWCILL